MGPVGVVVGGVVDDEPFELVTVPDDGAVEEFAADRSDPAFGVGVGDGRSDGGVQDLEAFSAEDLVEGVDELAAPVSDQRSGAGELISVVEEQVAGGLGQAPVGLAVTAARNTCRVGMSMKNRTPVAAEQGGVDGEEITGDSGLGVKEL